MATITNYPELEGRNLDINCVAEYSAIVNKYRVVSKTKLKETKGLKFDSIVPERGANDTPNARAGWFKYYATPKAFDKLGSSQQVVLNIYLD